MSTKSRVVSWMGVSLSLVQGLLKEVQKLGGGDEDVRKLVTPEGETLLAKIAQLIVDAGRRFSLASNIERDMTGWKCVEPAPAEEGEFELVLQEFLCKGEISLGGEEMVKRGKEQGASTGLRHLEAILREQDKIPAELRQFCLVSTEVWLTPEGERSVFNLYWDGRYWVLHCRWLEHDFDSRYRLVGSRKYQK